MNSKEILIHGFNEILILLRYLYSNSENYIEVENIFEEKLTIHMDENMNFVIKETGCIWENTIPNLLNVIEQLKESSSSKGFKNKWEEIKIFTNLTVSMNKF